MLRLAEQAAAAERLIETEANQLLGHCGVQIGPHPADAPATGADALLTLQTAPLANQSDLLVCEAIRLAWRQAHLPEQAMSHHWWQQLAQLAQSTETRKALHLPGKIEATVSLSQLVLSAKR